MLPQNSDISIQQFFFDIKPNSTKLPAKHANAPVQSAVNINDEAYKPISEFTKKLKEVKRKNMIDKHLANEMFMERYLEKVRGLERMQDRYREQIQRNLKVQGQHRKHLRESLENERS